MMVLLVAAPHTVGAAHLKPAALSDEFYSEQWSLSCWADDGWYYHAQFVVSNFGVGDNKSALKIEATLPDGSRKSHKHEINGYRYSKTKNGETLTFKDGFVSFSNNTIHYSFSVDKARVDLRVQSRFPVYRPLGKKTWHKTSKGSYDFELLAPRATISGTATVAGKQRSVQGWGLVDHSMSNIAPYNLAIRWLKVKYVTPKKSVLIWGFAVPGGNGDINKGFVWYGGNGKNFIASPRPSIFYRDMKKRDGSGYKLPDHISVKARGKAYDLNVKLQTQKLKRSKDVLKDIGSVAGFVVRRLMNPWDYTIQGDVRVDLTITATGKTITSGGQWDYVLQYITEDN